VSGLSAEELTAIDDTEVVDAVLGVVWGGVAGLEEAEVAKILEGAPEGFGVVHSVYLLDAEIQNGGFHQYFWNTKGLYVAMLKKSLASLGAMEHLGVLQEALVIMEHEPMIRSGDSPELRLEAFSSYAVASPFRSLDDSWYALPPVKELMVSYIRNRPDAFWEEE
jgi:hypothetical protein